jgi:replication factor C small subunit
MKELWVDKYRPKKVADYVWRDDRQKQIVESWIKDGSIPNQILSGSSGVGKSAIINVLINELNVNQGDVQYINASEETSVEMVRTKIINFASTVPWGDFKICVLEEADALSKSAQNSLKRVIEDYSSTCRFIFTSNNPHKIDSAIHSRCQGFHIESLDEEEFILKLAEILDDNDIDYDGDVLVSYVKATIPDLRKAIGIIQMNSETGTLLPPDIDSASKLDYMVVVSDLFRKGRIQQAREVLVKEASPEDYIEIFRYLYRNLDFWGDTESKQDEALLIIRDGIVNDSLVADREINMAATLVSLKQIYES